MVFPPFNPTVQLHLKLVEIFSRKDFAHNLEDATKFIEKLYKK